MAALSWTEVDEQLAVRHLEQLKHLDLEVGSDIPIDEDGHVPTPEKLTFEELAEWSKANLDAIKAAAAKCESFVKPLGPRCANVQPYRRIRCSWRPEGVRVIVFIGGHAADCTT